MRKFALRIFAVGLLTEEQRSPALLGVYTPCPGYILIFYPCSLQFDAKFAHLALSSEVSPSVILSMSYPGAVIERNGLLSLYIKYNTSCNDFSFISQFYMPFRASQQTRHKQHVLRMSSTISCAQEPWRCVI